MNRLKLFKKNQVGIQDIIKYLKVIISEITNVWDLTHKGLRMTGKKDPLKYRSIEIIQSENRGKNYF